MVSTEKETIPFEMDHRIERLMITCSRNRNYQKAEATIIIGINPALANSNKEELDYRNYIPKLFNDYYDLLNEECMKKLDEMFKPAYSSGDQFVPEKNVTAKPPPDSPDEDNFDYDEEHDPDL